MATEKKRILPRGFDSLYTPAPPDLRMVFSSAKGIYCAFFSIAVKAEALQQKFNGGFKRFVEKHGCDCNRELAVIFAMDPIDLDDPIIDLKEAGLVPREEFYCFDATRDTMIIGQRRRIDVGVDWLRGITHGDGTVLFYVKRDG